MALRYAVANGLWSDTTTWNGGTLPTPSDDVYANGYTVEIDMNVDVLSIRNTAGAPAVAGGTFILGENITLTCTGSGLVTGAVTLLTWSGGIGTTSNIISTSINGITANGNAVVLNGLGEVNVISSIIGPASNGARSTIFINNNSQVNIIGNLSGGSGSGDTSRVVWVNAVCTLNITGNVIGQTSSETITLYIGAAATVNITGNVTGNATGSVNKAIYVVANNATIEIVGNIQNNATGGFYAVGGTAIHYLKHTGSMVVNGFGQCVLSSNVSSINLFSGPFICGEYGTMPYLCARMHLIPSIGTYFEFRDETTNGALPPSAIAPATRLITLGAAVDAPDETDVRDGVLYANASLEGSAVIPHEDNVAYNVPVDHTVGTQLFSPEDVWNVLISSLTTPDSLGERLKNCSTVDTMGAQLEALN